MLGEHFLKRQAAESGEEPKKLSARVQTILQEYHWPGNVRELENVIERAVVLTPGSTIKADALPEPSDDLRMLPQRLECLAEADLMITAEDFSDLVIVLDTIERAYIEHVLRAEGGNKTRAAEVLGIDPSTLYRKIKRYDLDG